MQKKTTKLKNGLKKLAKVTKLPKLSRAKAPQTAKLTEADLINAESRLGATLFGSIPAGHRREFFRYRHNIWIYHESWFENGKKVESTLTYEVKENGVFKCPLGDEYKKIRGEELENFKKAVRAYLKLVKSQLYK